MAKRTIKLKRYLDINNEYLASAALYPGALVELHTDGKVRNHSTGGGFAAKMFALEDELQGRSIDDAYAEDDPVQVWAAVPGEEVLARLADDEDVAIGEFLVSNGDGTLRAYDDSSDALAGAPIVGIALEAVDFSTSSGALPGTFPRIAIRIV